MSSLVLILGAVGLYFILKKQGGLNSAPSPVTRQAHGPGALALKPGSTLSGGGGGGLGTSGGATIDFTGAVSSVGNALKHAYKIATGQLATEANSPQSHQEADTGPTAQPALQAEPAVDTLNNTDTNQGFDFNPYDGFSSLSDFNSFA